MFFRVGKKCQTEKRTPVLELQSGNAEGTQAIECCMPERWHFIERNW